MGLVVPIWIWLPVILWVMWKYERRQKQRLMMEMRWVGEEDRPLLSSNAPQLLLGERAVVRRGSGVMEMRSMVLVAVFGLLSAWLYAREPMPQVVQVAESTPGAFPTPVQWPPAGGPLSGLRTLPPGSPGAGTGTAVANQPQASVSATPYFGPTEPQHNYTGMMQPVEKFHGPPSAVATPSH